VAVQDLRKYSTLPILTDKHPDLGARFLSREARDNCTYVAGMLVLVLTGK
jgi:hypothetical protein